MFQTQHQPPLLYLRAEAGGLERPVALLNPNGQQIVDNPKATDVKAAMGAAGSCG
jgi:hypothetical protein